MWFGPQYIILGFRDTTIRPDLTDVFGLIHPKRGFSVSSTVIPFVWLEADHQCIVWCGQLISRISKAIHGISYQRNYGKISASDRSSILRHFLGDPIERHADLHISKVVSFNK